MKYLALLVLLVLSIGCNERPFKVGDCVRSYGNGKINIFHIEKITSRFYILSIPYYLGNTIYYNGQIPVPFYYLEEHKETVKINCSEI